MSSRINLDHNSRHHILLVRLQSKVNSQLVCILIRRTLSEVF